MFEEARNPNGSDIITAKKVPATAIMRVSSIEFMMSPLTLQLGGVSREKNSVKRGPELNKVKKLNSDHFNDHNKKIPPPHQMVN